MTRPVVFDGGILGAGPITGVGRAFLHALRAYVARGGARPVLLIPPGVAVPDIPDLEVLPTRAVAGAVARRVALPLLLRRLRARVFHAPIAALPSFAPCPTIATVHDLPWRSVEPLDEAGQLPAFTVGHGEDPFGRAHPAADNRGL